jgi:hypothetical protein
MYMHEWTLGNHWVTEVSQRSVHLLKTLKEIQLTEILHDFMEMSSQDPTTRPHPEPAESTLYPMSLRYIWILTFTHT